MFKFKKQKGFSIVEALVSITILTIAIATSAEAVQISFKATSNAKNEMTAFYLATEAIEFIKNQREENAITGVDWLNSLSLCTSGTCQVDFLSGSIESCLSDCDLLNRGTEDGEFKGAYSYTQGDDWEETTFVRSITIDETNSDVEAVVEVTVGWQDRGQNYEIVIKEHIFNWI